MKVLPISEVLSTRMLPPCICTIMVRNVQTKPCVAFVSRLGHFYTVEAVGSCICSPVHLTVATTKCACPRSKHVPSVQPRRPIEMGSLLGWQYSTMQQSLVRQKGHFETAK